MRVWMIVCALLCAGAARADGSDRALEKAGEAMALSNLCRTLRTDGTAVALFLTLSGVGQKDIEPGGGRRAQLKSYYTAGKAAMLTAGQETVCHAGLILYGPQGVNAPGLLVDE